MLRTLFALKMPIVLVSAEGINKKLEDLLARDGCWFDVVFHSEDSKDLYESMAKHVTFNTVVSVPQLNPQRENESNEDVKIRFQASLNTLRSMNVTTGMIISHHSVFGAWSPDLYVDEWEVVPM